MAEVLVLVEHADGALKKVSTELLTAARAIGTPAAVVTGAAGTADALADALAAAGAEKIYVAEGDDVVNYLVTPKVAVLEALVGQTGATAVITAATVEGKEVAARLAPRLSAGLLQDVIAVNADGSAVHSIFGGAFTTEAKSNGGAVVISVRPGAIEAEPVAGAGEKVAVEVPAVEGGVKITGRTPAAGGNRPELTEASVVIAGGRGVGSAEKFATVEALADALGGAVGASRAAVDSGYYPAQFQIGQTGKTVSPQLYIALGISGAIQHRAGMQTSKTIVAVNKDPEAPIFEIADYGVVGDLFEVAPQLTEAVKKHKG
ncbi:electron transfer flavoprotein subunit alpha/FixB family protein [Smaragdicoccus niigatensis]|uniref:electron transfer flavoprotein subunit alpha/FixB family protein n=1 Tax=Smaragdicoccus niigatensis TaxID=359359 RepID=UPI00036202D9|nr:electron transfer flavoprotein subunit alpha/FixB family protein [Smaragdicoccus niigatensis]